MTAAIQIRIGANTARCPACDAIDFTPLVPGAPITNASVMLCGRCGQRVTHGDLLMAAADDAVKRSAVWVERVKKRHAELKGKKD